MTTHARPGDLLPKLVSLIHRRADIDRALQQASVPLCLALEADRVTVYVASDDGGQLRALVQSGLDDLEPIELPVNHGSVAGYVAAERARVNIRNAYDTQELAAYDPPIVFFGAVDGVSGFRTRQILAAPIVDPGSGRLLGVVQALNHLEDRPFSRTSEDALAALCEALADPLGSQARFAVESRRHAEEERDARRLKQERARERFERAVAELKPQADLGLAERAPEAHARAREQLLQLYRRRYDVRMRPSLYFRTEDELLELAAWHPTDMDGVEWISRLAVTGHVGAQRLLDRILAGRLPSRRSPVRVIPGQVERWRALAATNPRIAAFLALEERAGDVSGAPGGYSVVVSPVMAEQPMAGRRALPFLCWLGIIFFGGLSIGTLLAWLDGTYKGGLAQWLPRQLLNGAALGVCVWGLLRVRRARRGPPSGANSDGAD